MDITEAPASALIRGLSRNITPVIPKRIAISRWRMNHADFPS